MVNWEEVRSTRVQIDLSAMETFDITDGDTIIDLDMVYLTLGNVRMVFEGGIIKQLDEIDWMMTTLLHTTVYQTAHIKQNPSWILLDSREVVLHNNVVDYAYALRIECQQKNIDNWEWFLQDIFENQACDADKKLISLELKNPPIIEFNAERIVLNVKNLKTHLQSRTEGFSPQQHDWEEE